MMTTDVLQTHPHIATLSQVEKTIEKILANIGASIVA